jgi:hypothetical protein
VASAFNSPGDKRYRIRPGTNLSPGHQDAVGGGAGETGLAGGPTNLFKGLGVLCREAKGLESLGFGRMRRVAKETPAQSRGYYKLCATNQQILAIAARPTS